MFFYPGIIKSKIHDTQAFENLLFGWFVSTKGTPLLQKRKVFPKLCFLHYNKSSHSGISSFPVASSRFCGIISNIFNAAARICGFERYSDYSKTDLIFVGSDDVLCVEGVLSFS
jgi:hypothetical protein